MTGHNLVPNQMDGYDDDRDPLRTVILNIPPVASNEEFGWRGAKFKCEEQEFASDDDPCRRTVDIFSDTDDQEFGWRGVKFKSAL